MTFPTDELVRDLHDFAVARGDFGITTTPVGRSYHLEELRRMIEIGTGPMPIHVAQRYVGMGRLWAIPVEMRFPTFEISLIAKPRTRLNSAETAFIDIMRAEIAARPLSKRTYC